MSTSPANRPEPPDAADPRAFLVGPGAGLVQPARCTPSPATCSAPT